MVQVSEKRDYLSIYGENSVEDPCAINCFTENDVLKSIGLTKLDDEKQLNNLVRPSHRSVLQRVLLGEEELDKDTPVLDSLGASLSPCSDMIQGSSPKKASLSYSNNVTPVRP